MKQYHHYQMNFKSKWLETSSLCMGLSLFLSAFYYLGICNFKDVPNLELAICFWIPMILGFVYLVLIRVVRYNAPGIYAILGAVMCVVVILESFLVGGAGKSLLCLPLYLLSAVVLLVVMGGFFPAKLPAMLMFGITIGVRVAFFDLVGLTIPDWIAEGAVLFNLAALLFLPMGIQSVTKKRRERV